MPEIINTEHNLKHVDMKNGNNIVKEMVDKWKYWRRHSLKITSLKCIGLTAFKKRIAK